MPTETFMLIGAGGHARVVFDALLAAGAKFPVEVRDDQPREPSAAFANQSVQSPALPSKVAAGASAHVAIGHNDTRRRLSLSSIELGAALVTVTHPRAVVSASAVIGAGTFLAALCVVGPQAKLGRGVIVNHSAVIDHDCEVGEFTHIAPGAILGGAVKVGSGVLIGAGAVLLPGVRVADGVTVGAGAVVTRDVEGGVVVGSPARSLVQRT